MQSTRNGKKSPGHLNHLMYILFSTNVQIPWAKTLQLKWKLFITSFAFRVTLSLSLDSGELYNMNPDLWGKEMCCSIMAISHKERLKQILFQKNMAITEIDYLNNNKMQISPSCYIKFTFW